MNKLPTYEEAVKMIPYKHKAICKRCKIEYGFDTAKSNGYCAKCGKFDGSLNLIKDLRRNNGRSRKSN